ncbi:hypothetical protein EYF80_047366 [Liparis tanakae]|uniref:Uncharacterized protein n=1 Tax=Liparis tanakae TaxID=230148 RepID=A0A4Z2FNP8_9TELE|nr:hypothetical protein EYF80_047366 [Liparis tanakae]
MSEQYVQLEGGGGGRRGGRGGEGREGGGERGREGGREREGRRGGGGGGEEEEEGRRRTFHPASGFNSIAFHGETASAPRCSTSMLRLHAPPPCSTSRICLQAPPTHTRSSTSWLHLQAPHSTLRLDQHVPPPPGSASSSQQLTHFGPRGAEGQGVEGQGVEGQGVEAAHHCITEWGQGSGCRLPTGLISRANQIAWYVLLTGLNSCFKPPPSHRTGESSSVQPSALGGGLLITRHTQHRAEVLSSSRTLESSRLTSFKPSPQR